MKNSLFALMGVATCALAASADTVGLWLFKDGAVGTDVLSATNALSPASYLGSGEAVNKGTCPVFSNDIPGKYVWANAAKKTLLDTCPRSVAFAGQS